MTRRKRIALRVVSAVAIVAWACFIFGFSGQTGGESGGLSAKVANVFVSLGDFFTGSVTAGTDRASAIEALQFPIRKAAHMSEYAVLALLVFAQLRLWPLFSGTGLPPKRKLETEALSREGICEAAVSEGFGINVTRSPSRQGISPSEMLDGTVEAFANDSGGGKKPSTSASPWDLYLHTLRKAALLAWTCATLYAATDEFHQLFVPGRAGLFTDVLIDATGAAIGLLIAGSIIALVKRPR